jgi:hypothetical protein
MKTNSVIQCHTSRYVWLSRHCSLDLYRKQISICDSTYIQWNPELMYTNIRVDKWRGYLYKLLLQMGIVCVGFALLLSFRLFRLTCGCMLLWRSVVSWRKTKVIFGEVCSFYKKMLPTTFHIVDRSCMLSFCQVWCLSTNLALSLSLSLSKNFQVIVVMCF